MKPVKSRAYVSLIQMALLLVVIALAILVSREAIQQFFQVTQAGQLGLLLNGLILLLFLVGLIRMMLIVSHYGREQTTLSVFVQRMQEPVLSPNYKVPVGSLIGNRLVAVQTLYQQQASIDQPALAAIVAAGESSRLTLVRFVNNILILSGVFGTIISLSVALVGAAGLLDSPENLEKMSAIIGGMATALSTTLTAILCYVAYSYFHMRLQDTRTQLLANLEEATTLYILPRYKSSEDSIVQDVAALAKELRQAADSVAVVQDRFLQAGERLQVAVDDLQRHVMRMSEGSEHLRQSSEDLRMIRDSIREGFRLDHKPD